MLLYTGECMCFTRPYEPKSVVDTLLCPKFIVYDRLTLYCVPNLTSVVTGLILIFFFIWRFTGLEGIILDVKYWGGLCPPNLNIGGLQPPQPPQLLRPCTCVWLSKFILQDSLKPLCIHTERFHIHSESTLSTQSTSPVCT